VGLRLLVAAVVLSLTGLAEFRPAEAQSVSTRIFEPIGCTVIASPITFGQYDVNSLVPLVGLGSVTYSCHESSGGIEVSKRIQIRISAGTSGSYEARYMGLGSDQLLYNLYLDANFRKIWGDGTRGTDEVNERVRIGEPRTFPVYGRVWERQDVAAGFYADQCHVTIEF
jgi:spore coat protein U-like protein